MTIATAGSEETRRAKPAGQEPETAKEGGERRESRWWSAERDTVRRRRRDGARRSGSLVTLYALF